MRCISSNACYLRQEFIRFMSTSREDNDAKNGDQKKDPVRNKRSHRVSSQPNCLSKYQITECIRGIRQGQPYHRDLCEDESEPHAEREVYKLHKTTTKPNVPMSSSRVAGVSSSKSSVLPHRVGIYRTRSHLIPSKPLVLWDSSHSRNQRNPLGEYMCIKTRTLRYMTTSPPVWSVG